MKSSSAQLVVFWHLKTASQAASTAAASFSSWKEYLAPGANAGWMDDMVVMVSSLYISMDDGIYL